MKIEIRNLNKTIQGDREENLLYLAGRHGLPIDGICAGKGTCGRCKIRVLEGSLEAPSGHEVEVLTKEELNRGIRLACKIFIQSDLVIEVLSENLVGNVEIGKAKIPRLPEDFSFEPRLGYGLAFDIGTTTVAGFLWNLETGELVDSTSLGNPQRTYGADVISRIEFAGEGPENLLILREAIHKGIEEMTEELLRKSGIHPEEIVKTVLAGNTTMSHLYLGENPETLARAPFLPAYTGPRQMGETYILPNIAGHVGGDITAGIVASRLEAGRTALFIDIGTNGELALFHENKLYVCSTAAGPAFEGAAIKKGMRATGGAIESMKFKNEVWEFDTIGGVDPIGICGSGLIDGIFALRKAGYIDPGGKILPGTFENPRPIIEKQEGIQVLKIWGEEIIITQKDIREVQLAKGAIQAGIKALLKLAGIGEMDLEVLYLAGAFGNYINKESAVGIGLLPNIPLERIRSMGNTAGMGASMALLSKKEQARGEEISRKAIHVELSLLAGFQEEFMKAVKFPND